MAKLYLKVSAPLYRGSTHYCLFCNRWFRRFLSNGYDFPVLKEKQVIGGLKREDAQCPGCYSDERERMAYLYIQRQTDLPVRPQKILHVAPEKQLGPFLKNFPHLEYISIDLSRPHVDYQMDLRNLRFDDRSFDAIICNHVLEHITEDQKAISEIFRVLKPGGWAMLMVPISNNLKQTYEDRTVTTPRERARHFGQDDHVRIYGADYRARLRRAGLEVSVFNFAEVYGDEETRHFRLNPVENMYVGRRPE